MPPLSHSAWALLVLAAIIIGISKTGFPGIGILSVPLVAMVVPARSSLGLILPMLILGDIMAVAFYRRHAIWKYLVRLLPSAVVGVVIGFFILKFISDRQLKPIIGIVILAMLALSAWRSHRMAKSGDIHVPHNWWFPIFMGILGGVITMISNAAGPIMVIYLLAMRLPKNAFMGTGAWYFLIINVFKVPFSTNLGVITADSLLLNAAVAPVILASGLAGVYLIKVVPEKSFTWIVQILAAISALQLALGAKQRAPEAPATMHSSTIPAAAPINQTLRSH